jgi:AcrR family transcriptional regulator
MIPEIFASDTQWPYTKAKTAVLVAASVVIREEGPRSATLKNIATKAGITEPAIFRHFDGVDGLFSGLFTAFQRIYERSFESCSTDDLHGLSKLRAMSVDIAECLAASRDFAYILVYGRHVFRGYPDLKAKVSECDVKGEVLVLDCVNEGLKSGELRSDLDPVSIATMFIGAFYTTAIFWIESGFAFDIRAAFADRMDDCMRMVVVKPAAKSREAKASARDRAAYFPLRPISAPRSKSATAKSKKGSAAAKAESARKQGKSAAKAKKSAKPAKSSPKRAIAAKSTVKKPTIRSK